MSLEQTLDSYSSVAALADYHEKRTLGWDPDLCAPVREEALITQKKEATRELYEFRPELDSILATSVSASGAVTTRTFPYTEGTQTNCSLLLYLRTFPWEKGETRVPVLDLNGGVKWYSFSVAAEEKEFAVPAGKFPRTYHLFNRELKYDIWFDRGPGRWPLEIRSRLAFGTAQAKLVEAY